MTAPIIREKSFYGTMTAIQKLKNISLQAQQAKYPSVPVYALTTKKYSDKTANGLTKCILDFLRLKGAQAERINCTGRMIDNRQVVTDVIGRIKTIGSVTWGKSTGTKGTADISATINGKSVKIEVKIGRDKQSEEQIKYQKNIESCGGIYYIAKDFESFLGWYESSF